MRIYNKYHLPCWWDMAWSICQWRLKKKSLSTAALSKSWITRCPISLWRGPHFPWSSFYHGYICRIFSCCLWCLCPDLTKLIPGSSNNLSVLLQGYLSLLPPSMSFLFVFEIFQDLLVHLPSQSFCPAFCFQDAWRRWSLNINWLSQASLVSKRRELSYGSLPSRSLKRTTSAFLRSRAVSLPCALLAALRILNSTGKWSLQPYPFSYPSSPSLLVRTRSSIASLLVGSCITWAWKLSSVHSRDFLVYLCPAVFSLQKISVCWKFPMRTRACECLAGLMYL